jgi:hypothetical protein
MGATRPGVSIKANRGRLPPRRSGESALPVRLEELHAVSGGVIHQDLVSSHTYYDVAHTHGAHARSVVGVTASRRFSIVAPPFLADQNGGYSVNCQKPFLLGASCGIA